MSAEQAGNRQTQVSGTVMIRRSDDPLRHDRTSASGLTATDGVPKSMDGKTVAGAVFLDLGAVVDPITDRHREFPQDIVIPIKWTRWDLLEKSV